MDTGQDQHCWQQALRVGLGARWKLCWSFGGEKELRCWRQFKQETAQCTGDSGWEQLQPPQLCCYFTFNATLLACSQKTCVGTVASNFRKTWGFQQQLYHMHYTLRFKVFFMEQLPTMEILHWRSPIQETVGNFGNNFSLKIFGTVKRTPLGCKAEVPKSILYEEFQGLCMRGIGFR